MSQARFKPEETPASLERSLPRFSRHALLLLLLILAFGSALRFAGLRHEALEGDEMFSRQIVLMSPVNEIPAIRQDLVHPPLYYLLLQLTTKVWGAGANGIRILSLFCGIVSLALIALLGRLLPDSHLAGLLAAALLAVNQTHIFYSQEARSYALYVLLVILLVFWVWRVSRVSGKPPSPRHWVLGAVLMTVLVYTHYIGAMYIACAVLAIVFCSLPAGRRVAAVVCASIAALCFVPWLVAIAGVYRAKNGLGVNLAWQMTPDLYALKQVYASALGLLEIRGGTTPILLLIALLVAAAFFFRSRDRMQQSAIVPALLLMSLMPPVVVFLLSRPPFNLPLFALRQVLPSVVLLILLACYGLERLAQRAAPHSRLVWGLGSAVLLLIALFPTLRALHSGPSRIPYDVVSQQVERDNAAGFPAYTLWFYGIGTPVNYYCSSSCVAPLPLDVQQLPPQLVLLYRTDSTVQKQQYRQLRNEGYAELDKHYYTDGRQDTSGTMFAVLRRRPSAAGK